jgi:hypothetical protein
MKVVICKLLFIIFFNCSKLLFRLLSIIMFKLLLFLSICRAYCPFIILFGIMNK